MCVLGYPAGIHWFTNRHFHEMVPTWLLSSKNWNMKDGKMVLIAHHLLESSIGAYIEWLVNELMMTANKIDYKDARLVMLPQIQ